MKYFVFLSVTLFINFQLFAVSTLQPPKAPIHDYRLEKHGDIRNDEYYWMKDRKNPEVINYLKNENSYLKNSLKKTEKLQSQLFKEMKSRIKEDDSSYPVKDGPYSYYTRYETGKQYPIYARKKNLSGKEEILFNVNKLAVGYNFYSANSIPSPNHRLAALVFDTTGRRFYDIKIKDLKTGKFLKQEIKSVTNNIVWSTDNKTLFYVKQDAETLRWFQVYRYNLETQKSFLIYEEMQDTFETSIYTALTEKHLFIANTSTLSSEAYIVPLATPEDAPQLLIKREPNHEFSVTEDENYFYILTNKDAKDFKVLRTPISKPSLQNTETWIPHREGTHIDNFIVFKDYVALASRENGLTQIEVYDKKSKFAKKLTFTDSAYTVELGTNYEYDSPSLRYVYYSLRSPSSVYDYEFKSQSSFLRKQKTVPNYKPEDYVSDRIFATARDGRKIPISLLMKKNQKLDGSSPLLIYGYGSYGSTSDPWFSSSILSLVDRGYIFAIAHIRGGGEMGRYWTDEGRTLKKKNTFYDFIDCTEHLIDNKYANAKKVFANGESAGGLLMGAISNLRPDLYKGIIAEVPFVDVLTTMLDDSIPLTTSEYDEWGNPNDKKFYDYMKSYSPYDNVDKKSYPNILITTGLHDSQVQYWEPAKWVARLRKFNESNSLILLKTDMESGHGGKTGRFDQLKDEALKYAFILETENR